ncbi:hypothetical protein BGX23_009801 [Mortierella sp. AD031]|nr:hypothetical protein BGX23_009801 [Mortierella sp. AD031]KAG0202065.1 hypothetical protein BGX33_009927 [Mortierella sp. NVP41]
MPATDSTMQPISGPVLVPGTQREPTTPPVSDIGVNSSTASGTATPSSAASSSSRNSVIGKSNSAPHHQTHHRDSSTNSSNPSSAVQNQNHYNNNNQNLHNQHLNHHHLNHHNNINNANSGLRRFPSIGNTTKLNVENATLRAKIVELERYLTGLKEELILAHRQIHAQRTEIKNGDEIKAGQILESTQRIQQCEAELKARNEECEGLRAQLQAREAEGKEKNEKEEKAVVSEKVAETGRAVSELPAAAAQSSRDDLDRIKALEEENARKDAKIKELLEKVDRLGTEVLNLERDKARLQRPSTPEPATTEPNTVVPTAVVTTSATLESLVPITAEAIVAATTPHSTTTAVSTTTDLTESNSSHSIKSSSTSPSTVGSDSDHAAGFPVKAAATTPVATTNSVGYDFAVEHPKLLAKFQALRMQHAQASEYVDSLESENRDLKVQLLDVSAGSALVA